jgi:hypothetical protein
MMVMPAPPASTKTSASGCPPRPNAGRAQQSRRPLPRAFAYVSGQLPNGEMLPLSGCARRIRQPRGFAIYRASHGDYQDNILPSGQFTGSPEEALDCACDLCLKRPHGLAERASSTINRRDH